MKLEVFIGTHEVGHLHYDDATHLYSFRYSPDWINTPGRSPLSPHLGFEQVQPSLLHSATVKAFFDNLLPEGRALDEAAAVCNVSKSSLLGLLAGMGMETAGALRIGIDLLTPQAEQNIMRQLPHEELSQRIRDRASIPFSVWDQRVRLSIAGYQDKIAVFDSDDGMWSLVDGPKLASTHIIKPEPMHEAMAGLTSNEFFCMKLAASVGLPVAEVSLHHVPEPVLAIRRFDRLRLKDEVRRLPVIDGCQLLNLPPAFKYERPYGDSRDVANIRDGSTFAGLFAALSAAKFPAAEKAALLRWAIFQIIIGNTDAHAKNLTFFTGERWLMLAPAYDLVSTVIYPKLEHSYAMAIGDAFNAENLDAAEWAEFCAATELAPAFVTKEIRALAERAKHSADKTAREVINAGADPAVVEAIVGQTLKESSRLLEMSKNISYMFKHR
ncbi:HipA domain-containing protein [Leeia sp. TBRC 13508]|uniref:HipA domain-containing protein n=1 Tax=Leeia speluncae TaxID=2884804 RepID=A0ABS8DAK4_9NEIS|nr:HipA domain-containing protein [Leeia speluncae]MCB6185162.1 HipA domain-containing protein [Leeia speluncae]